MTHNTGSAVRTLFTARLTGCVVMVVAIACELASIVPELLPGESWPVSVSVPSVLPTFWLTATSEVTATVPAMADEAPQIAPVQTSAGTWVVPWSALGLLVLVVGGVVARVLVVRRNRKRSRLAEDQRVQEAVDRALREQEQSSGV